MRILVIDDDQVFCRLLTEILQGMGFEAACQTDALKAFEQLPNEHFDLCIIDVRMPLILGTDLATAIKADHPAIKLILASAFADDALQDYARREKILLLSKPFTPSQLVDTVKRALDESAEMGW